MYPPNSFSAGESILIMTSHYHHLMFLWHDVPAWVSHNNQIFSYLKQFNKVLLCCISSKWYVLVFFPPVSWFSRRKQLYTVLSLIPLKWVFSMHKPAALWNSSVLRLEEAFLFKEERQIANGTWPPLIPVSKMAASLQQDESIFNCKEC